MDEFSIDYDFSDLALPLPHGWSFGSFNGIATITVDEDGWAITGIAVEKAKLVNGKWLMRPHDLDVKSQLERRCYHDLCTALELTRAAEIQAAVDEARAEREPVTYTSTIAAGRTM